VVLFVDDWIESVPNFDAMAVGGAMGRHFLPFVGWMRGIDRSSVRADLIAGLAGGLLLVPQGVAFALVAGMPPAYGLYTAIVPAITAALFGSSHHLVSGPTTAISVVVLSALAPFASPGSADYVELALTLSFLCGIIMLAFGCLRLGSLMNFVSHTVVVGFTAGAAVIICTSQFGNFFGLPVPAGSSSPRVIAHFLLNITHVNLFVTAVAAVTLLTACLVQIYAKRGLHVIVGLMAGGLFAAGLNGWWGMERTGIATLAALPPGLPPLSWPDLSPETVSRLLPAAFAIAALGLTEALSIARALALKTEQRIDGNQECIGQGLSNLVGAFFSSYPSSGSFNRSGLNLEAGARTPLAVVFSALFLLAAIPLFAPLAAFLPMPAMAGVLFLVAWGLIDRRYIAHILRSSRQESVVLVITFLSTLFLRLEFAIYVGVLLSIVLYLNRTSHPAMEDVKPVAADVPLFSSNTGLGDCPQLKILRLNGSLYFGAVDHIQRVMTEVDTFKPTQKSLALVCSGVNFIDLTGTQLLTQEALRRRRAGGDLYLCNVRERARQALRKYGCEKILGSDHVFDLDDADPISQIVDRLDTQVCASCDLRVFPRCMSGCRRAGNDVTPSIAEGRANSEGDIVN
jgi:SulP family sulfate permease